MFVATSEGRNTGFRKIRYALHNNGSPEPLFETDDERTYFSTTLYIHPYFLEEQSKGVINETIKLTEIEKRILEYVQRNPYATILEVAQSLGTNKSSINRATKTLKDKGILRREDPNKKRVWII